MKRVILSTVMVSFVLCFLSLYSAQAAEKTLQIGWMGALSGRAAVWGMAFKRIVDIQVEEYNAKGGIRAGSDRYKLDIIYVDDKFTADGGRAAAERLVYKDKVKFILGSFSTSAVLAQQKITEPNKVISMIDGQAKYQVNPEAPYSFRALTGFREMCPSFTLYVHEKHPEIKKVAVLAPNNDVGRDYHEFAPRMYKHFGLDVVFNELFPPRAKDFTPLLTKGLAAGPQLFDLGTTSAGSVILMKKQVVELGFTGPTYNTASLPTEKFVQAVGAKNVANHYVFGFPDDPAHAPSKLLPVIETYKQKHKSWFPVAGRFHLYLDALVRGIEAAGSVTDTTAVRDAIENLAPWESAIGMVSWGGKETYGIDHQIYSTTYILVFTPEGGQIFVSKIPPDKAKAMAIAIEKAK